MREKLSGVAIVAVVTAVFTPTFVMSLTVQSASAVCSPKNPNVFALRTPGGISFADASKTHSSTGTNSHGQPFANGQTPADNAFFGAVNCGGNPGVIKNGKQLCSG
jgi:hypothetical protein